VPDVFRPSGSGRVGSFTRTCTPVYIEIEIDGRIWWEGWGEECEYTFSPFGEMRADPTAGSQGSTHHERSSQVAPHRTLTTV
jgi:hypothetical protein